MHPTTTRLERLERAGVPPLFGREYRTLTPSVPRGVEAARAIVSGRAGVRAAGDDDTPAIEGTGTVYDHWYQVGRFFPFREKVAPGAFAKTIGDGADIRSMFNHDVGRLLARTKSGSLEVWETTDALHYHSRINAGDPLAMSAHAQVARGDVDGSSIWFSIVKEQWTFATEDNGLEMDEVVVLEAKLHELGPVVFPANEATEASARSLDRLMQGLGVTDADERREMVLDALADPERAIEALKRALGVDEVPDLRALCSAAGRCACRGSEPLADRAGEEPLDERAGEAPDATRAGEEPLGARAATEALVVDLERRQRSARGLAALYGLPFTDKENAS